MVLIVRAPTRNVAVGMQRARRVSDDRELHHRRSGRRRIGSHDACDKQQQPVHQAGCGRSHAQNISLAASLGGQNRCQRDAAKKCFPCGCPTASCHRDRLDPVRLPGRIDGDGACRQPRRSEPGDRQAGWQDGTTFSALRARGRSERADEGNTTGDTRRRRRDRRACHAERCRAHARAHAGGRRGRQARHARWGRWRLWPQGLGRADRCRKRGRDRLHRIAAGGSSRDRSRGRGADLLPRRRALRDGPAELVRGRAP